jgi:hypothetical protein
MKPMHAINKKMLNHKIYDQHAIHNNKNNHEQYKYISEIINA